MELGKGFSVTILAAFIDVCCKLESSKEKHNSKVMNLPIRKKQTSALPIWPPRSSWPASCNRACQNIVLGTPGFEDFDLLIHVTHFRNAEIVI